MFENLRCGVLWSLGYKYTFLKFLADLDDANEAAEKLMDMIKLDKKRDVLAMNLTYAEQRRLHGIDQFGTPSRFIAEIPPELVEEVRPRVPVSRSLYSGGSGGSGQGSREGWGTRETYGGGDRWSGQERRSGASPAFSSSVRGGTPAAPARQTANLVEPDNGTGLKLGQRVKHARFGDGVVLRIDGHGPGAQVEVNFERAGRKVLMAAYANLQPI